MTRAHAVVYRIPRQRLTTRTMFTNVDQQTNKCRTVTARTTKRRKRFRSPNNSASNSPTLNAENSVEMNRVAKQC